MKTLTRGRRLIAYGLLLVAAQSLGGCVVVPAYWVDRPYGHPYGHYDRDDYRGGWHGDRDWHRPHDDGR